MSHKEVRNGSNKQSKKYPHILYGGSKIFNDKIFFVKMSSWILYYISQHFCLAENISKGIYFLIGIFTKNTSFVIFLTFMN